MGVARKEGMWAMVLVLFCECFSPFDGHTLNGKKFFADLTLSPVADISFPGGIHAGLQLFTHTISMPISFSTFVDVICII